MFTPGLGHVLLPRLFWNEMCIFWELYDQIYHERMEIDPYKKVISLSLMFSIDSVVVIHAWDILLRHTEVIL